MRTLAFLFVSLAVLAGASAYVYAADVRLGTEQSVTDAEVVDENVYVVAERALVAGRVNGDALVLADDAWISASVTEDVALGARSARVSGVIEGDARIAAGTLELGGVFGGDLFIAGVTVQFEPSFRGAGDTRIHGTRVVYRGELRNDLRVSGRVVEINGYVEGDVHVEYRGNLIIGDETHITGTLTYNGPTEPLISEQARIDGEVEGTLRGHSDRGEFWAASWQEMLAAMQVLFSLSLGITSVLLVLVFPRFSRRVTVYVTRRGAVVVGYGALFFFVGGALVFLLLISVFGLYAALLLMTGIVAACMLAALLSPVLAGYLISGWVTKEAQVTWYWTIIGLLALEILWFLPFLGPIVRILFFFAVLGSIARGVYDVWWVKRLEPTE